MNRLIFLFMCLIVLSSAQVKWSLNGVRISVDGASQRNAKCVSDMNYGAIVVWEDDRYGLNDLYAQRVDSSGNLLWQPSGVPVCVTFGFSQQTSITMCSDEAGGAIVAWQDYRNATGPDIYAQRIDSNGNRLWDSTGVAVCTAPKAQYRHRVVPDGSNGGIIIWSDNRYPGPLVYDYLYAQRIDGAGNVRWTSNGTPIDTTAGRAWYPAAIKGESGDAYIVWNGGRVSAGGWDIYFQHIDSVGNSLLEINGHRLFYDSLPQWFPKIVWSNQSTIIIAWTDDRNWQTTGQDIYALRIDTLGNPLWNSTGVPLCTADNMQHCATSNLICDGRGGAIIGWYDWRNGNPDNYAQRIDINGNSLWGVNGTPVCSLPNNQSTPRGVTDDSMGVIFKWADNRNDFNEEYLQRIGADGVLRWAPNGVRACTVTATRGGPGFCSDGRGGAITVWTDFRIDTFNLDIYGQRVNDGHAPAVEEMNDDLKVNNLSLEVYPNPFSKLTHISFGFEQSVPSQVDENPRLSDGIEGKALLKIYDISGRLVKDFSRQLSVIGRRSSVVWDGRDDAGQSLPEGVYFVRLETPDFVETEKIILLK